ncbi:maoc family dehydratase-like protein [Angomonas deanei]|uniref:N-terminal half of MaoC dehydratase/MaoC like domain containing protein, putative n=1 Tax=Angomonas deanei TaxID=59799 RepID=A0A7G2CV03_9TRYP|nr:maoc family dehydratase-like protein [Angomonas deanei]CAD2222122.1 N-terminal half of MaoC dehydratase/MaoC like domain containing protein, putative [Angomonas deanei]|eukprot:EPY42307.1 maoc family dehydratase-like protein [Angomonas deanei]
MCVFEVDLMFKGYERSLIFSLFSPNEMKSLQGKSKNSPREQMSQKVIRVGMTATKRFKITQDAVKHFGDLIGDHNPIHSDVNAAKAAGFPSTICYGAFAGSLFSGLMATDLPGPNTVYVSQTLSYKAPIFGRRRDKSECGADGI